MATNENACKERKKWKRASEARKFCAAHRLHVKDGGLGDDHGPVSGVALQLGFGSLCRELPGRVVVGLWHGHEPVLPHELAKILQNHFGNLTRADAKKEVWVWVWSRRAHRDAVVCHSAPAALADGGRVLQGGAVAVEHVQKDLAAVAA